LIFTALNDKTFSKFITKIDTAIIINFIYYRHSIPNVNFTPISTGCMHPVFFYPFLRNVNNCLIKKRVFFTTPFTFPRTILLAPRYRMIICASTASFHDADYLTIPTAYFLSHRK